MIGIYKIQSIIKPNKVYIGSSIIIHRRWWTHLRQLKSSNHPNIKLQRHFNKYGETDLQFSILLECDKEKLIIKEQCFLNVYQPYFNICKKAYSCLGRQMSEETKQKMRKPQSLEHIRKRMLYRKDFIFTEEIKEKIRIGCLKRSISPNTINKLKQKSHNNPILQYDKNMNFIEEWHCAKCASKELNISESGIRYTIKDKRKSAGGFIWKYKNHQ